MPGTLTGRIIGTDSRLGSGHAAEAGAPHPIQLVKDTVRLRAWHITDKMLEEVQWPDKARLKWRARKLPPPIDRSRRRWQ